MIHVRYRKRKKIKKERQRYNTSDVTDKYQIRTQSRVRAHALINFTSLKALLSYPQVQIVPWELDEQFARTSLS